MSYASIDTLKATIPPTELQLLTDFDGARDTIDDARIQSALDDASAEINGYISKAVTLPIANPPAMLGVVCRDLAIHRLYANVGRITDTQEKLRDAAISYLKMVRDGKVSIGDETPEDTVQSSGGVASVEGPARVMTRDNLRGF